MDKEDELHAELEQQVQRDEAAQAQPPAAAGSWRTSGAQLQQRFADLAVHLAQRQLKNLR